MTLNEHITWLRQQARQELAPDMQRPPGLRTQGDLTLTVGGKEVMSQALVNGPDPRTSCAVELNTTVGGD